MPTVDWRKCRRSELGDEGNPGCTFSAGALPDVVAGEIGNVRKTIPAASSIDVLNSSDGAPGASEGDVGWSLPNCPPGSVWRHGGGDRPRVSANRRHANGTDAAVFACNKCASPWGSRTPGREVTYNPGI